MSNRDQAILIGIQQAEEKVAAVRPGGAGVTPAGEDAGHPDNVLTSARDRVFRSGANIFMLGVSSHAWKVNFCKFTNDTRNGQEDASAHSGLQFLAAVNGAGGGYELALACGEIIVVTIAAAR